MDIDSSTAALSVMYNILSSSTLLHLDRLGGRDTSFNQSLGVMAFSLYFFEKFPLSSILLRLALVLQCSLASSQALAIFTVLFICAKDIVTPSEGSRVVVREGHVVEVVVLCARPEWNDISQGPWEIITTVGVNSLEEAKRNPDVHRDDVNVACKETPQ